MSERADKESKICKFIEPIEGGGGSYDTNKQPKKVEDYPIAVLQHVEPALDTYTVSYEKDLAFITPLDDKPQKVVATAVKMSAEKPVMMARQLAAYDSQPTIRSQAEQKEIDKIKKLYGF